MGKALLYLLVLLALPLASAAQSTADTIPPRGRFLQPSVRVGELVDYELSYTHEPGLNVIFPDSTANYAPFEYVGKTYRPTRTRRGRSLDETVYHLRTFALDSVQQLALPVTILQGLDTLTAPATVATVRLKRTVAPVTDGAAPVLRENTTLLPVEPTFNYPYWLAGLGLVAVVLGGVALGFGRRWRRQYQLYKLRKNHVYFLTQYARHVERFTLSRSLNNMERAITLWKNYLTTLENSVINSLTTREIVAHYQNDNDVKLALRLADRVIYGNQFTEDDTETDLAFDLLRDFAQRRFEELIIKKYGV
ncbi:hypothetical protein J0X19_16875 [Hymenobacter sp. BT186]|uniref:Protein BatD n=1 Tax=Hymenobacter telluris TaxID=2816474 RepID=A0A939JBY8_9BACT|nr:hypothetical protein [Hymenobacter telluris]MBO0359636.1 hypothetical protein [Hymenobacter telluris]MBW3375663.1 hypothetical protein [Hymenobacter norwichensis]